MGDGTWGLTAGGSVGGGPEGESRTDVRLHCSIFITQTCYKTPVVPSVKTNFLTRRQVSRFGLCTGHRSWGSRMGVCDGSRGPGMHLWDGSGCSRVRERWGTGLRSHTDYPNSRRNILDNDEEIGIKLGQNQKKISQNCEYLL